MTIEIAWGSFVQRLIDAFKPRTQKKDPKLDWALGVIEAHGLEAKSQIWRISAVASSDDLGLALDYLSAHRIVVLSKFQMPLNCLFFGLQSSTKASSAKKPPSLRVIKGGLA